MTARAARSFASECGRLPRREYRDDRQERMVKSGGIEMVFAVLRDGNIRFTWPGIGEREMCTPARN